MNERLRRFLVENLQAQPEGVATDDSPLLSTHIVDSLGLLEVLSFLHDELGVVIADDEVVPENFETIGAIVRLLESKRG